jgi:hypothetical protein
MFQVAHDDYKPLDAPLMEAANLSLKEGYTVDLREALGCVIGQGLESASRTGRKEYCGGNRGVWMVTMVEVAEFHSCRHVAESVRGCMEYHPHLRS